jgi:enoyl-CoA hydratase/carnithine racemase
MHKKTILQNDKGKVRILTLNDDMKHDFMDALAAAEADEAIGAVVLTGAGRAFSAGMDLNHFIQMYEKADFHSVERVTNIRFPQVVAEFSKPLIAAINGPAVGWGFTLPLMADIRLCSTKARFACGFVRVGVTPEFGSSVLLPRIIGLGRALELVLTAREVLPEEALGMGLVNQVCQPDELLDRACELGETIAAYPRPATKMAKAILLHGAQNGMQDTLSYEILCFKRAMGTKEHYEAVKAMQTALENKRKAKS